MQAREKLARSPYGLSTVGENASQVFLGNIFSRVFVKDKEHGMPYLAASDTVLANIETGRFLSKKQAKTLKKLILKKDLILITCSGTLGNVTYTNKTFENHIATHDLIRVVPNDNKVNKGTLYAFLSGKYGYNQITQSQFGGVVKHINDVQTKAVLVPIFPRQLQESVETLIQDSAKLREEATLQLTSARSLLFHKTNLRHLTTEDYNYFGPRDYKREVSSFIVNKQSISTTSFHAFNYSERMRNTLKMLNSCECITLSEALDSNMLQTPSSVEVNELPNGKGIELINQKDIFDVVVKGKWIAKKKKISSDLLEYGQLLIAKIGTLGESESFCCSVFVGEELTNKLVSAAFIKLSTNKNVPSGYLYTWISSEYGFRYLRHIHFGTKLCYPNPKLLLEMPVPIIDNDSMQEIDRLVREAHTKRYQANCYERKAISMIEEEIESWTTSKKN